VLILARDGKVVEEGLHPHETADAPERRVVESHVALEALREQARRHVDGIRRLELAPPVPLEPGGHLEP